MQFEVKMRDGSTYEVDASYIEVVEGEADSSYALLGPVPGYPIAIVAAFPTELVETIVSRAHFHQPTADIAEPAATPEPANGVQLTEDIY